MFFSKLLLILNVKNTVIWYLIRIFVLYDGVLCAKEIRRLAPMDLKIYILAKTRGCDSTTDKI